MYIRYPPKVGTYTKFVSPKGRTTYILAEFSFGDSPGTSPGTRCI